MEWKLFDIDGMFLQEVNCQYDACDIAVMMYGASKLDLDFDACTAIIKKKEGE